VNETILPHELNAAESAVTRAECQRLPDVVLPARAARSLVDAYQPGEAEATKDQIRRLQDEVRYANDAAKECDGTIDALRADNERLREIMSANGWVDPEAKTPQPLDPGTVENLRAKRKK
jgi:hypothetical protein